MYKGELLVSLNLIQILKVKWYTIDIIVTNIYWKMRKIQAYEVYVSFLQ